MSTTLIDAFWFFGGNRERGIGRYLQYYFQHEFSVPTEERLWLVPKTAPDRQVNELLSLFGGKSLVFDFTETKPRQQELLRRYLDQKEVLEVFLSSPFERPWSLLDFQRLFTEMKIPMTAIVFDVLPLQFAEQILRTWSEEDRHLYQKRLSKLQAVESILTISPHTQRQLNELVGIPEKRMAVLKFGLTDAWIKPPREVDLKWWREMSTGKYVVTISGGEWRKNLEGTLRYFAKRFKRNRYTLVVICRLGRKELWRYQFLAWRLGIKNQVRWLGYVDERVKWRFLAQARVFLFLSRGEGLGIPILEAKKANIPEIIISPELAEAGFKKLAPQITVAKTEMKS